MCPPSLKLITSVFELLIFKLQTLLTKVHITIDSTFSNSLCSMISRFDLHSNELIEMHLWWIFRRSCMDLPSLGLGLLCCAELLWGQGLLLGIFLSSTSSWSIEQCIADTPQPKVVSHVIFLRENWAHVAVRSYFALGRSCPFSMILPRVWLEPWLRIYRPTRMGFLKFLIWRWSCKIKRATTGGTKVFLAIL